MPMHTSPGGFAFGVEGWDWGEPRMGGITFFLDGTAKVIDQHGRPIRGVSIDGKEVLFAFGPPTADEMKDLPVRPVERQHLATHAQVIAALKAERVDWKKLNITGWPQLPYAQLKELPHVPPTPLLELRKIPDKELRKDAMRLRRETDDVTEKEMQAAAEE